MWRYSGTGYLVLSKVVEAVSGMSYPTFLQSTVLAPLELHPTSSGVGPDASAQSAGETALLTIPGTGDLWSTPEDITTFGAHMRDGAVIGANGSRQRVRALASLGPESYDLGYVAADCYGYGLFVGTLGGRPAAFHPGDNPGWQSFAASLQDSSTDLRIVVNDDHADMRDLVKALVRAT